MGNHVARRLAPAMLAGLFVSVLLTGGRAEAQSPVAQLAQGLLDFEEAVKWEAVSGEWREARDPWIASMRAARTPQDLARGVAALENAMTWESVNESFRARRDAWVAELSAATTVQQVARLLIELEGVTKWEATEDSWRQTRPGWLAKMQRLAR